MAKYTPGANGPLSGKFGTMVGSSWNGIPYIKSLPRIRRKKKKPQPDEKVNQDKFAAAHYWLQPICSFLRVGFKGHSQHVYGFNAAKSYALKNAFTGEGASKSLDPARVRVSSGDLPLPENIAVELKDNTLHFTWTPGYTNENVMNSRDQVMMLAYRNKPDYPVWETNGQFRSTGHDTLELPASKNSKYHIYLAFVAHDRSRQSNSVYLGTIDT